MKQSIEYYSYDHDQSYNLLKFAFYSIKIQLETHEINILSVALLSQAKQSECGTVLLNE